jgi:hypothetical protein
MPSYPLTFPAYPAPSEVFVRRRTSAGVSTSPTSFVTQAYQHPGGRWEIDVTIQECNAAEAAAWTQFLHDLYGRAGTFNLNLNPYCPGLSPAPGTVTFRLANPDPGWRSKLAVLFGFTFSAYEDK